MPDRAARIMFMLNPETVRVGGQILSGLQGCEDPDGQRLYYEGLFTDLIERLLNEGAATKPEQTAEGDNPIDNARRPREA